MNARHLLVLGLCGTLVVSAGCDSTGPHKTPAALIKVSGDSQATVVGTALSVSIWVKVVDADSQPVEGIAVRFEVTAGGGAVADSSVSSEVHGIAMSRWTLGPIAGLQSLRVTVQGLTPLTFTATGLAGAAGSMTIEQGGQQTTYFAQRALPVSLRVRVVDRFGNPVPGVAVSWSVPSRQGAVAAAAPTTDSAGRAEAVWTLGSQAGVHTATAATGAGTPLTAAFTADLRPASLTFSRSDTLRLWIGDTLGLAVRLADSLGAALTSDSVRLSIDSASVAEWVSAARIVAKDEGYASARAAWRTMSTAVPLIVGTTLRGQVFTADSLTPVGVRFFVRAASGTDSVDVAADGTFVLRASRPLRGSTVDQYFDAATGLQRGYLPSAVFGAAINPSTPIKAILIPVSWTIASGDLAGQVVSISADRMLGHGWSPVLDETYSGPYGTQFFWPDSVIPIAVYFANDLRECGSSNCVLPGPYTAQESIQVWTELRQVETRLGMSLFRPADKRNLPVRLKDQLTGQADTIPFGAIGLTCCGMFGGHLDGCNAQASTQWGLGCIPYYGDLVEGVSYLVYHSNSSVGYLVDRHELGHALWYGHTCYFPSLMGSISRFEGNLGGDSECQAFNAEPNNPESINGATDFTKYDVAHLHLVRRVVNLNRAIGSTWSMRAAQNGERVFIRGLQPVAF